MWKYNSMYSGDALNNDSEHIEHYGIPRRSGRYKFGSGKDPYQSTGEKPAHISKKQRITEANKYHAEKAKAMSYEELLQEVNRLKLEETYKQLTQIKVPESRVKKAAAEVVEKSVKEVSGKLLTVALTSAANKALKTKIPTTATKKSN